MQNLIMLKRFIKFIKIFLSCVLKLFKYNHSVSRWLKKTKQKGTLMEFIAAENDLFYRGCIATTFTLTTCLVV